MAQNQAKRQHRLVKKRRKDKLRKYHSPKSALAKTPVARSPRKTILEARRLPLYECLINPSWQEKGLATLLISRSQSDGNLVFGVYMVDIFCLGLKNTFCNANFTMVKYKTEVVAPTFKNQGSEPCSFDLAHQIIYGAIEFAEKFGFKPNRDYKQSQNILEPPETISPSEIDFGIKGKPFFIPGPSDNVERILNQLKSTAGEGNYDYLSHVTDE